MKTATIQIQISLKKARKLAAYMVTVLITTVIVNLAPGYINQHTAAVMQCAAQQEITP